MVHELKWLTMSKKQKIKPTNTKSNLHGSSHDDHDHDGNSDDDPVRACLQVDLKPHAAVGKRNNNTTSTAANNATASSKEEGTNCIDRKEVYMNWSDAHQVDIREGEQALIVKCDSNTPQLLSSASSSSSSTESQKNMNNVNNFNMTVCKVRISSSDGKNSSSKGGGTPVVMSRKKSGVGMINVPSGEIRLSPEWIFDRLLASPKPMVVSTPIKASLMNSSVTSPTAKAAALGADSKPKLSTASPSLFTSPSKSKFSFAKGGGGDALISPPKPSSSASSFASPPSSASKFSFAKGRGEDALISPRQTPTTPATAAGNNRLTTPTQYAKVSNNGTIKGFVIPITNLSQHQLQSVCPAAHKLILCPVHDATKTQFTTATSTSSDQLNNTYSSKNNNASSSVHSHLSTASHVIQSLIISKYKGTYIQSPQSFATRRSSSHEDIGGLKNTVGDDDSGDFESNNDISVNLLETLSISFRGQMEYFYIVGVTSFSSSSDSSRDAKNNGGQNNLGESIDNSLQQHDESNISNAFQDLTISDTHTIKQSELHLQKLLECYHRKCAQDNNGAKIEKQKTGIAYKITSQTQITLTSTLKDAYYLATNSNQQSNIPMTAASSENHQHANRKYCAGLDATVSRIKDALLPPILHPNLFPKDGVLRPPKGALLYGPAGVGKSLLAAQIAQDLSEISNPLLKKGSVFVRSVQCADLLASTAVVGEAEKILTGIFEEAERKAETSNTGSLVIFDDVHLICPRRGGFSGGGGAGVDQLAGTMLALLDGIGNVNTNTTRGSNPKFGGGFVVLAITTDPSVLDPALRRPGRLDVEVEVPVPDDKARAEILRFHLSQLMLPIPNPGIKNAGEQDKSDHSIISPNVILSDDEIETLARLAKGFTGADCKLAVKEGFRHSFISSTSSTIKYSDLEHAIRITKPSAIKSVAVEVPHVPWSAIGGMGHVKSLLKESIELPLTHPHLFEMMQVPPPKGILLYGPPGCSKTLMARAIATEGNMNFLAVKGPELLSKWLGESERALASLFRRARLASPAVIFFDEIDAIASKRGDGSGGGGGGDRLLSQLLTELDGVTSGGGGGGSKGGRVVVVGATNRPDVLDAALTRPGRMDRMIYVGLPDEQGRKSIFEIGLRKKSCNEDVDVSVFNI